ncbi:hypothetical protein PMAYCL1PPCAC_06139, partial [Pristionchus mayeri]
KVDLFIFTVTIRLTTNQQLSLSPVDFTAIATFPSLSSRKRSKHRQRSTWSGYCSTASRCRTYFTASRRVSTLEMRLSLKASGRWCLSVSYPSLTHRTL